MAFIKMKILEQEFQEWNVSSGKTKVKQDKYQIYIPGEGLF